MEANNPELKKYFKKLNAADVVQGKISIPHLEHLWDLTASINTTLVCVQENSSRQTWPHCATFCHVIRSVAFVVVCTPHDWTASGECTVPDHTCKMQHGKWHNPCCLCPDFQRKNRDGKEKREWEDELGCAGSEDYFSSENKSECLLWFSRNGTFKSSLYMYSMIEAISH